MTEIAHLEMVENGPAFVLCVNYSSLVIEVHSNPIQCPQNGHDSILEQTYSVPLLHLLYCHCCSRINIITIIIIRKKIRNTLNYKLT